MKKRILLSCLAAIAALAAIGPASASAAGPEVVVCVGSSDNDGNFLPAELNSGGVGDLGLGLSQTICPVIRPDDLSTFVDGLVGSLSEAEPPSEPPTEEELQAILDAIANADPSSPLAVLGIAITTCQNLDILEYCQAVLGGVLSGPIPLNNRATLTPDNRNCFAGTEEGTGTTFAFGPSGTTNFDYSVDYTDGNLLGLVSGTTDDGRSVSGIYGPSCGTGPKVLVLFIN